jgi:hypothetical protein
MSKLKRLHPGKQLLFALLSVTDLFLTWWLLDHSDGEVYESNPVANWWLARHGWLGLVAFKAGGVLLVIGLVAFISRYRPRAGGRILGFACAILALVVLYSAFLWRWVPGAPEAAWAAAEERSQRSGDGGRGGRGRFGRDPLSLLTHPSVREELKLSEDQVKQVAELASQERGSFRSLWGLSGQEREQRRQERAQASEKALAETLTPEQLKRVKQISWQQRGVQAFGDAEVAAALELTDEQKKAIQTLQEEARGGMHGGFRHGGHREGYRGTSVPPRPRTEDKVMDLLTAEQKAKWQELAGEPFQGEIPWHGFGGGGRHGRGWRPRAASDP